MLFLTGFLYALDSLNLNAEAYHAVFVKLLSSLHSRLYLPWPTNQNMQKQCLLLVKMRAGMDKCFTCVFAPKPRIKLFPISEDFESQTNTGKLLRRRRAGAKGCSCFEEKGKRAASLFPSAFTIFCAVTKPHPFHTTLLTQQHSQRSVYAFSKCHSRDCFLFTGS